MTAKATLPDPRLGMNKLEADYAEYLLHAGVAAWGYESIRLKLGNGAWYKPDFVVYLTDGTVEFHEVKGSHWREAARVRIKAAAAMHPFIFRAVTRDKGEWRWETFTPAVKRWLE